MKKILDSKVTSVVILLGCLFLAYGTSLSFYLKIAIILLLIPFSMISVYRVNKTRKDAKTRLMVAGAAIFASTCLTIYYSYFI